MKFWALVRTPVTLYLICLALALITGATVFSKQQEPPLQIAQKRLQSAQSAAWWNRPVISEEVGIKPQQVAALNEALNKFLAEVSEREIELNQRRPGNGKEVDASQWWLDRYRVESENVQSELAMVKAMTSILTRQQIDWIAHNKPALLKPGAIPRR
ncbi:MAG: hypothetical protein DHS20C11_37770 [Lysobacteraceae bacterium]|nr:MAG: hypothetical protein DHS20C11_37770 [Xanthomonadaceae bacterium]